MQIAILLFNNISYLYDDQDTLKPLFAWHYLDIINCITLLIASDNVFLSFPHLGLVIVETMLRPTNCASLKMKETFKVMYVKFLI